ncbi:hypothetical protein NSMS1_24660 [Nostoc sp. MS1]|nr:hypothetical protein NSMS1_24660 [Nostoc sp. MS1]
MKLLTESEYSVNNISELEYNEIRCYVETLEDEEIITFINASESSEAIIKRTVVFLLFMLKSVDVLIDSLKNDDADIRKECVWALGEIGDYRAAEAIIVALQDSNVEVREAAREAYEKMVLKFPAIINMVPF